MDGWTVEEAGKCGRMVIPGPGVAGVVAGRELRDGPTLVNGGRPIPKMVMDVGNENFSEKQKRKGRLEQDR